MVITAYFRRFVAWVTALKNKYLGDPFFHSELNVVVLQIVFAISLILIVAYYFNYLYEDVSAAIISGLSKSIETGNYVSANHIIDSAESAKHNIFIGFVIIATLVTATFSFIIARITLTPVRTALKSQKRFISDIAHELRTPLSVIKTNTEVALIDDSIPQKLQLMLRSNIEELDRTSEIINNLLSFNNFMRPQRMQFSNVDMSKVVDSAILKMGSLASEKEVGVTFQKIGPFTVCGNATALEQIVTNLLKNSINYTPKGGRAHIMLEPDYKGNVILTLSDNGIGISPHDLIHVFEPFYRAERSRNRRQGSSGLGLTIVSELVKLHSGKVTIKSSLNYGTTVIVCIPYSKVPDSVSNPSNIGSLNEEVSLDFLKK